MMKQTNDELPAVGAKANRRTGAVCLKLPRAQLLLLLKLFPVDEEKIAQSALKSFDAHAASRLTFDECFLFYECTSTLVLILPTTIILSEFLSQ